MLLSPYSNPLQDAPCSWLPADYTPVAEPRQQPPHLLTWSGLVVGQIKHDDKHARPGDDERQDQDPGQRGAEGGVEVVGERLLGPSRGRRRRRRLAALAVDNHGGGRWPGWRQEKKHLSKRLRLRGRLMPSSAPPPTSFYSLWLCFSLGSKVELTRFFFFECSLLKSHWKFRPPVDVPPLAAGTDCRVLCYCWLKQLSSALHTHTHTHTPIFLSNLITTKPYRPWMTVYRLLKTAAERHGPIRYDMRHDNRTQ